MVNNLKSKKLKALGQKAITLRAKTKKVFQTARVRERKGLTIMPQLQSMRKLVSKMKGIRVKMKKVKFS